MNKMKSVLMKKKIILVFAILFFLPIQSISRKNISSFLYDVMYPSIAMGWCGYIGYKIYHRLTHKNPSYFGGVIQNFNNLETERLIIRKIKETDYDEIFSILSNEENTKYYGVKHNNIQETKDFIKKTINSYNSDLPAEWIIVYKENNKIIGLIGFYNFELIMQFKKPSTKQFKKAYIAYILDQAYWGKGLANEVLQKTINFGFHNLNFYRIEALCLPENIRSINLLEKFMKFEGTLRDYVCNNNFLMTVKIYSILKREYVY